MAASRAAVAETPVPFVGGPVTVFDVEVGIIDSGALLDAQAVVSHDERYVTINARVANSSLLALQTFRTQTISAAGSGFVGGVEPAGHGTKTVPHALPSEIDQADRAAISVLNRRGVFLIAPLK